MNAQLDMAQGTRIYLYFVLSGPNPNTKFLMYGSLKSPQELGYVTTWLSPLHQYNVAMSGQ